VPVAVAWKWTHSGAEFSFPVGFFEELDLAFLLNIWTCESQRRRFDWGKTYIKLPPLDMLACLFAGDDNDELGYLASVHPLFELRHDLLDVGLDLVVGRDWGV